MASSIGAKCAATFVLACAVAPGIGLANQDEVRASGTWTLSTHPCPGGNRTDALQMDNDGRLWVGCGTAAEGKGLFTSVNGGASWAAANVTPAASFTGFRVNSISRGHDGALYVAGINTTPGSNQMVVRVNTSVVPSPVTLVLAPGGTAGTQFPVGNYRELPNGSAIAEHLNGNAMLYRPNPSTGTSANSWTASNSVDQIIDMTLDQSRTHLVGGGSRINAPPRIFLPPTTTGTAANQFVSFTLPTATNWDGEIWGVASSSKGVYAVGIDQDTNTGKIFVNTTNPYAPSAYVELSFPTLINPGPGTGTWARGVCANGNTVMVVGERQPLGNGRGIVLLSSNAGQTFTDVTPVGVSASVSKCALLSEAGDIVVVGSAGFVGVLSGDGIFASGFD